MPSLHPIVEELECSNTMDKNSDGRLLLIYIQGNVNVDQMDMQEWYLFERGFVSHQKITSVDSELMKNIMTILSSGMMN